MSKKQHNLIWLDLEMTGLDIDHCHIIEIAAIVTDRNLDILAETESIAIHQPIEILESMDSWCKETHFKSGLVDRVKSSDISVGHAESIIFDFISEYTNPHSSPLCGNSVWQDRKFLAKYMPKLEAHFHYRLLDVSSFKIAAQLWKPELLNHFKKHNNHLALADIKESIEELKFYRQHMLSI
ncbi:MAG: oligoribonuclease [Francisellaceae bacterium]